MNLIRIRAAIAARIHRLGNRFGFDAGYVVENGAWLNARLVFGTLLSLVLAVAFANLLTPEQYGQYKYIIAAVTFWGGLFLAGANIAVTAAVARGAERTFLASIPLQARWDTVGALCIAATGAYYVVHGNVAIGIPIIVAAVAYPTSSVLNTYAAYFAGKREFSRQAFYESVASAVYFAIVITGLLLGANPGLLAALFFISSAIGHTAGFKRAYRETDRNSPNEPETLSYAKQLSLVSIPSSLMLQFDNIMVFHYLGSADLAIYSFAMLGPDKLGSFLKFLPAIAMPKYAQRSTEQLQGSVPRRSMQFSLLGALVAVAYAVAAPLAFKLLFPQYLTAVPYTQVYAFSLVAAGAALGLSSLMAQGRIRRLAILQIGLPLMQLVFTFAGIRLFGLWGAIGAKLFGDFSTFAVTTLVHQYRKPELS